MVSYMERYQSVHSALHNIQTRHLAFFDNANKQITQYVNIEPNLTNDWINVTVKDKSNLPQDILEEIETVFVIVK